MADTSFTSRALNTALPQLVGSASGLSASSWIGATGANGTYSYVVTAFNGGETLGSESVSWTNSVGSGTAISFSPVPSALNYRLYRSGAGATGYQWVANSEGSPIYDSFSSVSGGYLPTIDSTNLESRTLATKPSVFYTVPANVRTLFKEAILANSDVNVVTFNLYLVPSGESASIGNAVFNGVSLDPNETKILSLNSVLDSGDTIQANSSSIGALPNFGSVSIKISGIEISDS